MRPLRNIRRLLLPTLLLLLAAPCARAQGGRGFMHQEWTVEQGDSTPLVHILPVYVFSRPADLRRYRRLIDAVIKVYPIAQIARDKLRALETELAHLPTKKE